MRASHLPTMAATAFTVTLSMLTMAWELLTVFMVMSTIIIDNKRTMASFTRPNMRMVIIWARVAWAIELRMCPWCLERMWTSLRFIWARTFGSGWRLAKIQEANTSAFTLDINVCWIKIYEKQSYFYSIWKTRFIFIIFNK